MNCKWCGRELVKWQTQYCSKSCSNLFRARERRCRFTPPPAVEGAAWLPLADGRFALVDAELASELNRYSWCGGGSKGQYAKTIVGGEHGKGVYLHQMVLPGVQVDHKNGNTLDCRRDNLRPATQRQNNGNMRSRAKKAPYKGIVGRVTATGEMRWITTIRVNGKRTYVGCFKTPEEAARAYDAAARQVHGEFACVNFPEEGERGALQ